MERTLAWDDSMVGERAVHGIWGFAKDFGLSGRKVGVPNSRDPEVRTAARALAWFAPVSTRTQAPVPNLLSDAGWLAEFLAENRRRLRASATAAMDLLAAARWQRIPRSARVKILPGTAFACPEPGWFRLCHATDASTVATGVNRLTRALETS